MQTSGSQQSRTASAPALVRTESPYRNDIPIIGLDWSEVLDSCGEPAPTKIGVGRGHLVLLAIACGLSVWLADYLLRLVA